MTDYCSRCGRRVQVRIDLYTALWVQLLDDSPSRRASLDCDDFVLCPICCEAFRKFMRAPT